MAEVSTNLIGVLLGGVAAAVITNCVTAAISIINANRTRKREEQQRALVPRTEFEIECDFHGPISGSYLVNLRFIVNNRGSTLRVISNRSVRIRSIKTGDSIDFRRRWDGDCELEFPTKIVHQGFGGTWTVEPGIRQVFPFQTKIDEDVKFVVVKYDLMAQTEYEAAEGAREFPEVRMFEVIAWRCKATA